MKTLYQMLIEAGVEVSSHYSDLYAPATEQVRQIIKEYEATLSMTKIFKTSFVFEGKVYYDIPGCYEPYWSNKMKKA